MVINKQNPNIHYDLTYLFNIWDVNRQVNFNAGEIIYQIHLL